jgi:hypothetical protein
MVGRRLRGRIVCIMAVRRNAVLMMRAGLNGSSRRCMMRGTARRLDDRGQALQRQHGHQEPEQQCLEYAVRHGHGV